MTDHRTPATPSPARSDAEWRAALTPEQYRVLRQKGTERAFTGELWDEHRPGAYRCAGCNTELFRSDAKFDSGTGWPSFFTPADPSAVATRSDRSLFMTRTEAVCATCGGNFYDDTTMVVLDLLRGEGFPEERARREMRVPAWMFLGSSMR